MSKNKLKSSGDFVKVNLPLHVGLGRKTRIWLTLNNYRNWHYQVSNGLKVKFKKDVSSFLNFSIAGKVKIDYDYYAPDKRKRDLMNVISVVDKFFQDAMVERGCIEADDLSIVVEVNSKYCGIDRGNARLEATITKL
jgi:hypothetical protein